MPALPVHVPCLSARLQELAADPDIYDRLAASIAPSIWQLEDVKKGVLCQLFGGVSKVGAAGGQRRWPASRVVSPAGGVASGCNCC